LLQRALALHSTPEVWALWGLVKTLLQRSDARCGASNFTVAPRPGLIRWRDGPAAEVGEPSGPE
jgi:hypothetical protein